MKFKRTFTVLLLIALLATSAFVGVLPVSAAYDYLFPVNNGGVIGYVYGYSESYGSFHVGIDLHARTGDDTIYAAYSGTVGATADSCYHVSYGAPCEHYATFGNYIRINQDDGTYAYYGHLKQYSLLVKTGDRVVKGQPIATMGSSGYSTGKHLHFEVRTSLSSSSHINVNSKALGGLINYTYSGYGATTSYTYEDITDGVYYLKSSNGKYMSVDGGIEADGQNISAADFAATDAFRINFKKTSKGYELRPLCAENSVVNNYGYTVSDGNNITLWEITDHESQKWNFELVEGGYAIRSTMNEECCLAVNSENNVYVAKYTGAANQIWTIENTLTFDSNGGDDAASTVFKKYGESYTFQADEPTREGYKFLGWSEDKDASFASYAVGSVYTENANASLYAVWAKAVANLGENLALNKTYTVTGSGVGFSPYNASLTDGEHSAAMAYDDSWFAFYHNATAEAGVINAPGGVGAVVIDLGKAYSLTGVNASLVNKAASSVARPNAISIYLSEDGESFTPAGAMPITDAEQNAYWSFAQIEGNARFVKIEFTLSDYFAFVNEIEVYGNEISATPPEQTEVALGDVNLDGAIDQFDYILVKRHYFETRYLTDDEFVRGDVNSDGIVDQFDYILISRHYFGTYKIG